MFNFFKKLINKAAKDMEEKEVTENAPAEMAADEKKWLEHKINRWKVSNGRRMQILGELYYMGEHEILKRKRTAIGGTSGELVELTNLPCNKIIDNQYGKIADQKRNYLLGQPLAIDCDNKTAADKVRGVLDAKFIRTLSTLGLNSINSGISWVFPYYNENGDFKFKIFPAYEILPFWKDEAHTEVDFAVRYYCVEKPYTTSNEMIEKVEIYRNTGISHYVLKNNVLYIDHELETPYIKIQLDRTEAGTGEEVVMNLGWERVPLVPFKFNAKEQPLLERCKKIQDAINETLSEFRDNMQEDSRNTILVIKNYDGENLSEFRRNLSAYGAVKVRSTDGMQGGVETLKIEVNAQNYETILKLLKKALVENCRGFDAKDDSVGGNANQMHISAMFNDIDIDANEMELEFQASLDELMFFVKAHLANNGEGDFEKDKIKFIFNRDMLMNENEILDSLVRAGVQIPNRTLLSQVPFIDDVDDAEQQLEEERNAAIEQYSEPFTNPQNGGLENGENENENEPKPKEQNQ